MNLLGIQGDIKTKLGTVLTTTMRVDDFPQRPEEYILLDDRGAALAHYIGSTFTKPEANRKNIITQTRTMEWGVSIVMKQLFDGDGLLTKMETIRAGLTGWTPSTLTDLSPFYAVRDGFVAERNGQWWYEIVFGCEGPDQET